MKRVFNYVSRQNTTILNYLSSIGYSKGCISFLKKSSGIFLNGQKAITSQLITAADKLEIIFDETDSSDTQKTDIKLDIIYEDEDVLLVNKAARMPVHTSRDHKDGCLSNALAHYYDGSCPFRCITRLDSDTTGLVLLAKNMYSTAVLSRRMKEREIEKEYIAFVENKVDENCGTIDQPIARKNPGHILRIVDPVKGQRAVTHYRLLEELPDFSVISLKLETGRTHQIRVHMSYIGHPIVGDCLYNPQSKLLGRQALHVSKLSFRHPVTNELLNFSLDLPQDMKNLLLKRRKV